MLHYSDYLRDQAVEYRKLAESADDSATKRELSELAATCDEAANRIDDRRASG
jgi:hypothetical protein